MTQGKGARNESVLGIGFCLVQWRKACHGLPVPQGRQVGAGGTGLTELAAAALPVRKGKSRSLRQDALNLPNLLTMLRIAMIPAVMFLLWDGTPVMNFWAAWVYTLATITDALDGYLARKQGLVSVLGKFLDPLADKLIVMATLVLMVAMGRVPAWVVVVILARELSISMLRTIAATEGVVIAAGEGGKAKTALQMIAVLFLMLHHRYKVDYLFTEQYVDFNQAGLWLLYLSVFFAVTSAGEYAKLFIDAVEAKERRLAQQAAEAGDAGDAGSEPEVGA